MNTHEWLTVLGMELVVLGSGVAVAADEPPAGTALEEIVVTARKRSESEQSVPLSMTTFGSVTLEREAINTFVDYATKVPNLAFAPTGDGVGTARTVSIRGISGDNVTSFYIDETPLPDSVDPRVLDIDHIEVLRGPQGTLYGARSMGGTVRIVTKEPSLTELSGAIHAGVSTTSRTNSPNYVGDAIVNIPLVQDWVALRLSGFYDEQAGYFKRSFCSDPAAAGVSCFPLSRTGITTVNNVGAIDSYGGSASLTIKPSDSVTITPRVMMQRANYNGFPMADFLSMPGNGIGYPAPSSPYTLPQVMTPSNFTQARFFNVPEGGYDSWGLYSLAAHLKTRAGEFVSSTAYFDRKVHETEDATDFVWAAITSGACATPAPYCNPPAASSISEEKDYQRFVEEVRFVSDLAGRTQFVLGAFYSDFHGRLPNTSYYPPAEVPNLDAELGGPNNPDFPNLLYTQDFHNDIREPAMFGEVSFQATDAFKMTAGLRWYQVKTASYGYVEGLAVGGGPALISPRTTDTESGVNPKLDLTYQFAVDRMLYATVAKGFRPGGLGPAVPPGVPGTASDCVASLQQVNPNITLADTRRFQSDSLWNYEIGTKTSWLDHRVTLDAAAFLIEWKDIQQVIQLACGFTYTANAGAAQSRGGEVEARVRPAESLELSLGLGYQDAKITQASPSSPQQVGSPVYQVPDWTGNGSVTYTTALTSSWKVVSGVDYSYIGKSFSGNNDPRNPRERACYSLLDARIALGHGPVEVAIVGKNLANTVANLGDSRSISAEVPGRPRLFVNPPRTVGVEVRTSF
jgi:iron complex outermembrane recepter protein